ncbi:LOB domain-containing protein 4-like isoform X1 [Vigna umbellata]|uniref:LOB domain-containing protein 4-like isoform X1 n=1 Tax=Vigna umbellata TaxID=87088 RepID=UPI001F5E76CF|nr:LOB domain-containing protein 4-like isoform X1 [Vigna umbellata]
MKDGGRKQGAPSPCAACKLLRRRCAQDCVFAPYFPADEPHKFANVHRVFGASNVNKMLQELQNVVLSPKVRVKHNTKRNLTSNELPEHQRGDAVSSMVYEANARVRDPVYGCVGAISSLQQQIDVLQTQLAVAQAEAVHLRVRQNASLYSPTSPTNTASPSSKIIHSQQPKPIFDIDMDMIVDHTTYTDSIW